MLTCRGSRVSRTDGTVLVVLTPRSPRSTRHEPHQPPYPPRDRRRARPARPGPGRLRWGRQRQRRRRDRHDIGDVRAHHDADTDDGGAATGEGDVETAAETALAEIDGTVFSVDSDDQGWDVTIVTADGVENDVELGPDATTVTRGPAADEDDDNDDDAETELLLGASVDYLAAMEAALGEVQGTVTGVDLSEDDGTAIWEVQLDEDTADETTVEVDAQTGEVLRTERDDCDRRRPGASHSAFGDELVQLVGCQPQGGANSTAAPSGGGDRSGHLPARRG